MKKQTKQNKTKQKQAETTQEWEREREREEERKKINRKSFPFFNEWTGEWMNGPVR